MIETVSLDVVRFCAIECKLQMSGEISVWNMVEAMVYAQGRTMNNGYLDEFGNAVHEAVLPTLDDIIVLGRLVEPYVNTHGFRRVDVRVGSSIKAPWEEVPRLMLALMEAIYELTPAEFFKEYEEIHPFADGNGRTGQILFNWLNGTLFKPEWAPDFWGDRRRTVGYGA